MFSLIISIIAIALVAALAGASVYYGGSAFNKGTAGADASTLINGGQQVNGAVSLAKADSQTFTTLEDLETAYLTQVPGFKGNEFVLSAVVDAEEYAVIATNITPEICTEVSARGGVSEDLAAGTEALFGCNAAGSEFYYKVNP